MARLPLVRACSFLLLLVLLAQPFGAASSRAATTNTLPTTIGIKLIVQNGDQATIETIKQANGALLADYGAFSLWRVPDAVAAPLKALPTVGSDPDFDTIFLRDSQIDTRNGADTSVPNTLAQVRTATDQLWLVQFVGPIKDEWLASVEKTGAKLVGYMPNNAYAVWADDAALTQLEELAAQGNNLQWTGPLHPAYRIAPFLKTALAEQKDPEALIDVSVQFVTTDSTADSLKALQAMGGIVYKAPAQVLGYTNISLQVPVKAVPQLARQADVFNLGVWAAPIKLDERQNQIMAGNITDTGPNIVPSGPGYLAWLNSQGLPTDPAQYPIVDVVDDGIDNGTNAPLHPDFYLNGVRPGTSRVIYIGNCTSDSSGNGIAGHGNLNAGIVGGFNNLSGAAYVDGPSSGIAGGYHYGLGVSPYTRLAGTKIFTNAGGYSVVNCGNTDQGVVNSSYLAGATMTSNSWGAPVNGAYDDSAQAYDALTRDASTTTAGLQPMAHIFAAGNDGPSAGTIGSPGTGKNVITVGATENVRDDGVADGCNSASNDDADDVVGFSSRGPTDDGRTKPDITAPGSHIMGPASQAPGYNGTGVCGAAGNFGNPRTPGAEYYPAGQTLYTWSSGTSHSTPAVAGAASLLYTKYRFSKGAAPSPAMLKAYLLNSTRYLDGVNSGGTLPTNNQGWGDVYLKQALDGTSKLFYDQQTTFGATGAQDIVVGQVPDATKPFRVTLAWTDAPGTLTGNSYVNDLNLEVTVGGQTYKGNVFNAASSATGGVADGKNNVENVYLPAGVSGSFSIKIVGANIAGDGVPGNADTTDQDFALVIYNGSQGPTGTLTGAVRHGTGTPIAGATVSAAGSSSTLTNAAGQYSMPLPAGTYTVTASSPGYSSQTVPNIVITDNVTSTQNFTLLGGRIQGTVRDSFPSAQPIAGATVTLDGGATTTTDNAGFYAFPTTTVGTHTLVASYPPFYANASATVNVSDDVTTTQNLVLPAGALTGLVTNATNGSPIANANVAVGAASAKTNAAGRYVLRRAPGSYTVSVNAVGYTPQNIPAVAITNGVTNTRDVALTPIFGYTPASLSRTFTFGAAPITDTLGLVLTNNNTSPFTYTITEQGGRFNPLAVHAGGTVLLVNRSATTASTAASAALVASGYTVEAVTNTVFEGRTVPNLLTYVAVVYLGNTGTTATSASNTKLMAFLDAGGRLLIADNDLGYFNEIFPFYDDYMDAQYGGDEPDPAGNNANLTGVDIMSGVNPTSVDSFPDYFTPKSSSTCILRYLFDNSCGGSRITRLNYKAIYIATDFNNLGTAATGEAIETSVMQKAINWLISGATADNIPWLKEAPASAAIPAGGSRNVAIGWYPNAVAQPGTYTATLNLNYTTVPTQTYQVPVTMVINPAPTQAQIKGTITSTGVCDVQSLLVAGAKINITSSGGFTTTLTTDANGYYSYFVATGGTYSVTVMAPDHLTTTQDVTVAAGGSITSNFTLRLQKACIKANPTSLQATLDTNSQIIRTVDITSAGALPLQYTIIEAAGAVSANADQYGYIWSTSASSWIDASDGTSYNPADDGEQNVTLPFSFPFYDVMTNTLRISNNGAIRVGATTGEIDYANVAMNAAPNYFLAPFWDDFNNQTGAVYVKTIGTTPNQKAIIQWTERPHYDRVGAATFQVVLSENGNIAYQYQDVDFGDPAFDAGASATVGIRGNGAANTQQYSFNQASLNPAMAVCFTRPGNTLCSDVPWLSESPTSGTLPGSPPSSQTMSVTFDSTGMPLGTYTTLLAIVHNGPQPIVLIPVTMTVGTISGEFSSAAMFSEQVVESVITQTMAISNTGNTTLNWLLQESDAVASGCSDSDELPWLGMNPMSGSIIPGGNTTVQVVFDTTSMSVGTHSGSLCLLDSATRTILDSISVTMEVTADGYTIFLPLILKQQ